MAITDDIVKTLKDPTPLYAVAGTADLAAEKLQRVPALIEKIRAEAPERFEKIRSTDAKVLQERVTAQAKDAQTKVQTKVTEAFGTVELDLKKIGETVQDFALQGVGRAAEAAVRVQETYGTLAERGKGAVATWRGDVAEEIEEIAVAVEPDPEPAAADSSEDASAPAPAKKTTAKRATTKKPAAKSAE
ncbi:hypothetical protein QMK19_30720 [Streptomyces sp. H10-C2]|uniref:hypothetical protein n=1 Tax=unclassified Streptomyces TaxID=2593676 RepID=UPI0024BB6CE2|nr:MULTISPECIES: hypothetical protein [unclassified Streptomyces]MDJ0346683.1 hypothetical protein [Streptomyces sp. PH10-H1]MDJ0373907.1 hypothetical protein [Streptomyces sp. H10-C2]